MSSFRCRSCGQFAGRSHTCPTHAPERTSNPVQVSTMQADGLHDKGLVGDRVARARRAIAKAPTEVGVVARYRGDERDMGEWARRHFRMELTPGELDDAARFAFRNGQCHSMGAALAERTGWPVIVLVDRTTYKRTGRTDDSIRHIYVEAPDGTWIDVNGFNDPEIEIEDAYDAVYIDDERYLTEPLLVTTDAEGVKGLATKAGTAKLGLDSEVCMLPTCVPLARTYVDEILTEAGWTDEAIRRGQPENSPV